jgi:histone acetyltransferase SAS3
MAVVALMEEQLQHSMATSEEDADFEEDEEVVAAMEANADAFTASDQLRNGMLESRSGDEHNEGGTSGGAEGVSDEDAEGEEDDEMADPAANKHDDEEDEGDEDDEEEDEDGEGVGAVKIQPGLSEDDDEDALPGSDEESGASVDDADDDESKDSTDAEVEAQWEPAAEEEDDEPTNPNRCMYVAPALIFFQHTDRLQILSSR